MEPSYVTASVPTSAEGEVRAAFAKVDMIWQFVFGLPPEGRLMVIAAFNLRETFWDLKQLQDQHVVWLYAGRWVAHPAGTRRQGDVLPLCRYGLRAHTLGGTQRWISQTTCICSSVF